jgi:hypothetical protein
VEQLAAWIEEQPENKEDQTWGQKTQTAHQIGAVNWEHNCSEDKERSAQQMEAETPDCKRPRHSGSSSD